MNTLTKFYKEHIKSFAAWVGGVIVTMVLNLIQDQAVWPQTKQEWIQYALTSFGAAFAVWVAPTNKITQDQLNNDPNVIGGVVVPDAQVSTAAPPPYVPPASPGQSSWV